MEIGNPTVSEGAGMTDARTEILTSIREHLAASMPGDALHANAGASSEASLGHEVILRNGYESANVSLVEIFRERLEAVGGHCLSVFGETEAARAVNHVLSEIQTPSSRAKRIALSNAALVKNLMTDIVDNEVSVIPRAAALFGYEIGITTAQVAIAETGTLVLESDSERHRLVSLLPPVHIALLKAADICLTLGGALKRVARERAEEMSRAITFITGPSRTADIELTLSIGVHGPKELYVIVIN
jgi:L-lactate dehydrogenase complex protein LldG